MTSFPLARRAGSAGRSQPRTAIVLTARRDSTIVSVRSIPGIDRLLRSTRGKYARTLRTDPGRGILFWRFEGRNGLQINFREFIVTRPSTAAISARQIHGPGDVLTASSSPSSGKGSSFSRSLPDARCRVARSSHRRELGHPDGRREGRCR